MVIYSAHFIDIVKFDNVSIPDTERRGCIEWDNKFVSPISFETSTVNMIIMYMNSKYIPDSYYYWRIEMSPDGAVHVTNYLDGSRLGISKCGQFAIVHNPTKGIMFNYHNKVEIQVNHHMGKRYAKMWQKGISFTNDNRPITFLMDAGGIRTTIDWFMDLNKDCIKKAYFLESRYNQSIVMNALAFLYEGRFWINNFGVKNWIIVGITITETVDGGLKIYKNNTHKLSTNIRYGSASLTTPYVHCTTSTGSNGHFFVRRGNCRMHYDGRLFIVRNEGQSAGIEENNQLKIY